MNQKNLFFRIFYHMNNNEIKFSQLPEYVRYDIASYFNSITGIDKQLYISENINNDAVEMWFIILHLIYIDKKEFLSEKTLDFIFLSTIYNGANNNAKSSL